MKPALSKPIQIFDALNHLKSRSPGLVSVTSEGTEPATVLIYTTHKCNFRKTGEAINERLYFIYFC